MDNILEFLLPLLFILIYFFGNRFGKKEEEAGDEAPARKAPGDKRPEASPASEEARRIQEEIRRLIVARQGREEDSEEIPHNAPVSTSSASGSRPEGTAGQRSLNPAGSGGRSERGEAFVPKSMESLQDPVRLARGQTGGQEQPSQANQALRRIQEQEDAISRKQSEADALRKKANALHRKAGSIAMSGRPRLQAAGVLNRDGVKSLLRNPQSTRHAFLLQEILGTPVGLRSDDAIRPLWKS